MNTDPTATYFCIHCGHRHPTPPPDQRCTQCKRRQVVDLANPDRAEIVAAIRRHRNTSARHGIIASLGAVAALALLTFVLGQVTSRDARQGRGNQAAGHRVVLTLDRTTGPEFRWQESLKELSGAIAGVGPVLRECTRGPGSAEAAENSAVLQWDVDTEGRFVRPQAAAGFDPDCAADTVQGLKLTVTPPSTIRVHLTLELTPTHPEIWRFEERAPRPAVDSSRRPGRPDSQETD